METSFGSRKIRLQFATDQAEAESFNDVDIVIVWPSNENGNDRGYRLLIDFMIKADGQIYRPKRPAAMVFNQSRNTQEKILSFGNPNRFPFEDEREIGFASIQMDVNEYRRIGRAFDPVTAFLALEAMHDLVVEEQKANPESWSIEIKKSPAFLDGLLRTPSRYFAYRRGYEFLVGNEVETISKASANATLHFKLDAFSKPHCIPLSFGRTASFNRRINVLIGRNGVGKSQTLAKLVKALANPNSRRPKVEPKGEFNRVIAFSGVAGQTSLPKQNPAPRTLHYHFYDLSPGQVRHRQHPVTAAMVDIMRSDDYLSGIRRLNVLAEAIKGWMSLKQIYLPLLKDEGDSAWNDVIVKGLTRYVSVNEFIKNYEWGHLNFFGAIDQSKGLSFRFGNKLTPLSSGQEFYFRFALHLCVSIDVGTLVLIDEPENHLHPNFITALMALLRDILAHTGSFALIASHSPFVIREVTHNDVVILERNEDGSPRVRKPRLRTLGASVAAVSQYVFGDETMATLARLTFESQNLPSGSIDETAFEKLSKEYSNEAISHIRSVLLERESNRRDGKT